MVTLLLTKRVSRLELPEDDRDMQVKTVSQEEKCSFEGGEKRMYVKRDGRWSSDLVDGEVLQLWIVDNFVLLTFL